LFFFLKEIGEIFGQNVNFFFRYKIQLLLRKYSLEKKITKILDITKLDKKTQKKKKTRELGMKKINNVRALDNIYYVG
jgi:hypothetical protein